MNYITIALILMGVLLNTAAQLLLKAGMNRFGHFDFALSKLINIGTQLALNPYIFLGMCFYVISVGFWLVVLSRVEVSMAYPMASIAYILVAITAYYLFGEELSMVRFLGILTILAGVYLVARS